VLRGRRFAVRKGDIGSVHDNQWGLDAVIFHALHFFGGARVGTDFNMCAGFRYGNRCDGLVVVVMVVMATAILRLLLLLLVLVRMLG